MTGSLQRLTTAAQNARLVAVLTLTLVASLREWNVILPPTILQLVVETLASTKEPLTSFEGIQDQNVKELIIDNEGNLETWRGARKAVTAIGMLPEVAGVLSA